MLLKKSLKRFYEFKNLDRVQYLFLLFFVINFNFFFNATKAYSIQLELELGQVKLLKNKGRIPGNTGTIFDTTELSPTKGNFYRLNLYWPLMGKSSLRFLYAPLKLTFKNNLNKVFSFKRKNTHHRNLHSGGLLP